MKNYLLIGLFCLSVIFVSAQQESKPKQNTVAIESNTISGSIKGKIIDNKAKDVIPFANVILYNADSTFSTGSVSDMDGNFSFEKLKADQYTIEIYFIGYKSFKQEGLKISKQHPYLRLKSLKLIPTSITLDEAEVRASSATVEYKLDKKIINPENSISSAGGNASDILRNAPSVDVDIEGNVSLRGSQDFHVMINGKPTILKGSDALKQIAAENVKNIEIITNPSVKYAPDGTSGIININTKKNLLSGFSGKVSANARSTGGYSSNINLGYKTGKFNYFLSAYHGSNKATRYEEGYTLAPYHGDVRTTTIDGESKYKYLYSNLEGGVEFEPNKGNSFTLTLKTKDNSPNMDLYENNTVVLNNQTRNYEKNNINDKTFRTYGGSLSWYHLFKEKKDHNLQAVVFYQQFDGDIYNTIHFLDDDSQSLFPDQSVKEIEDNMHTEIKIDYTRPIGEHIKLETGLESKLSRTNSNYNSYVGTLNSAYTYDFEHNNYAAYASAANNNSIVDIKAGVRVEAIDRDFNVLEIPGSYTYSNIDLYPSIHLSKRLPKEYQLQASYSKRINRLRPWQLNPYPVFSDEHRARTGNPELMPEYMDSYEAGVQKRFKRNSFSIDAFLNICDNAYSKEFFYKEGVQYMRPVNIDKRHVYGLTFSANLEPFRWWSINASGAVYGVKNEGMIEGVYDSNTNTTWYTRLSSNFKVHDNSFLELRTYYRGKSKDIQYLQKPTYFADISVKQFFLKKKLSATLSVRDLFGTYNRTMYSYAAGLESKSIKTRAAREVRVGISYSFNNFRKKRTYQGSNSDYGNQGE